MTLKFVIKGKTYNKGQAEKYLKKLLWREERYGAGVVALTESEQEWIREYVRHGDNPDLANFSRVAVLWWNKSEWPGYRPVFLFTWGDYSATIAYTKLLDGEDKQMEKHNTEQMRELIQDQIDEKFPVVPAGFEVDHYPPFKSLCDNFWQLWRDWKVYRGDG